MRKILTRRNIVILAVLVLGLLWFILRPGRFEPRVASVTPANGTRDVFLATQIDVGFERPVPESEQGKFFVRIVPGIGLNSVWVSPTLLRVIPTTQLGSQTQYGLTVLYDGEEIFNSSFETIYIKEYTQEEIDEINNMAFETAAAFYQLDADFPFIKNLPIEGDNYRIVYDFDRQEFRIRLLMPSNAPEETKQEALNAALAEIVSIGVVVEEYGYYVLYIE